jgi:hypothetical protein
VQDQNDYLEDVLMTRQLSTTENYGVQHRNMMRLCIKKNFPQSSCRALPTPSDQEDILRNLSNVLDSELNPAFVKVGTTRLSYACNDSVAQAEALTTGAIWLSRIPRPPAHRCVVVELHACTAQ